MTVVVSSPPIVEQLVKLGLDNRKTATAEFCDSIPEDCVKHYIRGIIDGDGSITFSRGAPVLAITGTEALLLGISRYFSRLLNLTYGIDRPKKIHKIKDAQAYKLKYEGKRLVPFLLNHLYLEGGRALRRKEELACKIVDKFGIRVPNKSHARGCKGFDRG